jgi:hypothetical protein
MRLRLKKSRLIEVGRDEAQQLGQLRLPQREGREECWSWSWRGFSSPDEV